MDITSSLVTNSDLQSQIKELCTIKLPGPLNPEHLPTELKKEQESLERQMLYHLCQAAQLYQTKGQQLNDSFLRWYETTYYHHPSELIGDPDWQNYYPAIVLEDRPYRTFSEAVAAPEANQRYLTTQLIHGTMGKKQQDRLLHQAKKLVCTLDPRDKDFFSEATLSECLESEGLGTNKDINKTLGRKHYTPVTKSDKRNALAMVWEKRNEALMQRWEFGRENWDGFELEAVKAFTNLALREFAESGPGYCCSEFDCAVWSILAQASKKDEEDQYWLDPREEDTWTGLRDLAMAASTVDMEQMHYDFQSGAYTAQQWVKATALPALYGASADWWTELPDLPSEPEKPEGRLEALLIKSNRTPREEVELYKALCLDTGAGSAVAALVREKYGAAIKRVFSHA